MPLGVRAECVTCVSLDVVRPESRGSRGRLGTRRRRFMVFAAAVWALVLTPSRAKTHCFAIGAPRGKATWGEVVSLWKSALSPRPDPLHSSVSFLLWDEPHHMVLFFLEARSYPNSVKSHKFSHDKPGCPLLFFPIKWQQCRWSYL